MEFLLPLNSGQHRNHKCRRHLALAVDLAHLRPLIIVYNILEISSSNA